VKTNLTPQPPSRNAGRGRRSPLPASGRGRGRGPSPPRGRAGGEVRYVIGLTGNIATGKSLVLQRLRQHGAFCLDADKLVHECMRKGQPAYEEIWRRFGDETARPDGEIDRATLARIVFADPEALRELEAILHPRVVAQVEVRLAASDAPVAVVEAIKLLEASLASRCQAVWVTTSSTELQLERLMLSRGLSREAALLRLRAQPSLELKVIRADVLLENDGSRGQLEEQIDLEWRDVEAQLAPGQGSVLAEAALVDGIWQTSEESVTALAEPFGAGSWRLSISRPSRAPRLWRPLLATLERKARGEGRTRLTLRAPARTGYRQFLLGMGYAESEDGGREPGEAAFSRDL